MSQPSEENKQRACQLARSIPTLFRLISERGPKAYGEIAAVFSAAIQLAEERGYERGKRDQMAQVEARIGSLSEWECGHGMPLTKHCEDCGAGPVATTKEGSKA